MKRMSTVILLLFAVMTTSVLAQNSDSCFESVANIPASCNGGSITSDNQKNPCRTIICEEGGNTLQVLACNKPDGSPQYFEMYKQSTNPGGLEICIADTCIKNNGYDKSDLYPICAETPEPSPDVDPGKDSSILLTGGMINEQALSSINVLPGEQITGTLTLDITNAWPTNISRPIISTPTWGNHESSFVWHGNATDGTYAVNFTAPTTPGTYHIIFAYRAELDGADVASMTNWKNPEQWNDGNDVAEWSETQINDAKTQGRTVANVLFDSMHLLHVPATAVQIHVQGEDTNESENICFNSVNELPVQCKNSQLTQDTKAGCRTVECTSGSNSVKAMACQKTNDGTYFEIFKQSSSGTPPEVCFGNDCLKSGWGYERGENFPICTEQCTPTTEVCDSVDNDCDGQIDENNVCAPSCTPEPEACDGVDNDCDTQIDEGGVCASQPVCGNAIIETGEQCDDGNSVNGDGCSNSCQEETLCHSSVKTIPASCTSTITKDTTSGTCRTIECGSNGNTIKVLACDKPNSGEKTHFEMYRQSFTGSPPQACIGETCLQFKGYDRSDLFPICEQGEPSPPPDDDFISSNPDPGADSSLAVFGTLNGQPLSSLTVAPGEPITGQLNLTYINGWPETISTPLGVTNTWEANQNAFTWYGNATGKGKIVNINEVAPFAPGTYYLIFAYRAELDAHDVFSMTSWANDDGDVWNDGNDVADWNSAQLSSALANGKTTAQVLFDSGYEELTIPAAVIEVTVQEGSTIGQDNESAEHLSTYTAPGIPFSAEIGQKRSAPTEPLLGSVNLDEYDINHEVVKAQIQYNFSAPLSEEHSVQFTWRNLDTNNSGSPPHLTIPAGSVGPFSVFGTIGKKAFGSGEIDRPGNYQASFHLQGSDMNQVQILNFSVEGNTPECEWCEPPPATPAEGASVSLVIDPLFPADNNIVLNCNANDFSPTSYTFNFGDGTSETRPVFDIYHTYAESGQYTASCTATDGVNTASDNITVNITSSMAPRPLDRTHLEAILHVNVLQDRTVNLTCQPVGYRREGADYWQLFGAGPTNHGYVHPGAIYTGSGGGSGSELQFRHNTPLSIVNVFPSAGEYYALCVALVIDPRYHPDYYEHSQPTYHNVTCHSGHACQSGSNSNVFTIPPYDTNYDVGDPCTSETGTQMICTGTNETCTFESVDPHGWTVGYWQEEGVEKSRTCHEGYWFPLDEWNAG